MNPATLLQDFAALHFLRPWWLCALALLPLLAWWWRRRQREGSAWHAFVDPHLLSQLLESRGDRRSRIAPWMAALGYVLAVLALAGPSWRRSEQPLWRSQTPLVVALDLSSASLAADLPPSRLAQARAKLATLLRERNDGQIGLVVFAGDAFTVAPLTDDAANVALFLDALEPDVMPRDGQRAGEAIGWSARLLKRAGANNGDIVVLTDHADDAAMNAASEAAAAGHRVSALGLGTEAGAAYRRLDGSIASTRLDPASLRELATSGNGRYAALSSDDSDLRALGVLDPRSPEVGGSGSGFTWRDEGYWLLLPLMLLALFAFRRRSGGALALAMLCAGLPLHSAHAESVWRRPDQAGYARIQRGNEAYRKGDFQAAAQQYDDVDTATAHYNRGNALAKAGQYPEAIKAYDEALRRQPRMADAIANKRAVEAAMKRQSQPQSKQGSQQQKSQGNQGGQSQQSGQSSKPENPKPDNAQQQPPKQDAQQQKNQQQQSQDAGAKLQDAKAQQQADQAQRERMQRALQQARKEGRQSAQEAAREKETPAQRERRLANEAWLKRVPDDPGGLLRAKFRLEYERRASQGREEE